MKVTRTILASTDNSLYYQFWNPLSKVYRENFGIKPTLIWFGKPERLIELELSMEWGNIIVQDPNPRHDIGWQSAWAIFWFMSLYPDDIFCTMGIDQIPLSPLLIRDKPSYFLDETYLILADDGYSPDHWSKDGSSSPTSFHIVKGSIANKVYDFDKSFNDEIDKVAASGIKPYYEGANKWGLDESYASHNLRKYRDNGGSVVSSGIFSTIRERRIECCRTNETSYDKNLLIQGWYGDAHLCRPYSDHKKYIDSILSLIPKI